VPCEQTISIGLTQAVVADNPRVVIARADRALYLAKEDGRNQARSAVAEPVAEPVAVDRVAEPVAPASAPVRPAQPGRSDRSL